MKDPNINQEHSRNVELKLGHMLGRNINYCKGLQWGFDLVGEGIHEVVMLS